MATVSTGVDAPDQVIGVVTSQHCHITTTHCHHVTVLSKNLLQMKIEIKMEVQVGKSKKYLQIKTDFAKIVSNLDVCQN